MDKKVILMIKIVILTLMMGMKVQAEYVTSKDGLHLRFSPNASSESLCVMPYGSQIEILAKVKGKDREWAKVDYKGKQGYCATAYIDDEDPMDGMTYLGEWNITAYAYTGSPCANGNFPTTGYTIACNSLPFGTQVYIEGVGIRTVEDRGPSYLGDNWCDLYLGDYSSCVSWGSQYRSVYLLN